MHAPAHECTQAQQGEGHRHLKLFLRLISYRMSYLMELVKNVIFHFLLCIFLTSDFIVYYNLGEKNFISF